MKPTPKTISVLLVEPGKYPCKKEIPASLEAMQAVVGGLIEIIYPWPERQAVLVCNEEGKLNNLPLNRYITSIQDVICGSFFICDGEGDSLQSLSDDDMELLKSDLYSPEFFWQQFGKLFIHKCSPEEYAKLMNRLR